MNNIFDFNRFGSVVGQRAIHGYKIYLISAVGFAGALFLLLYFLQLGNDFRMLNRDGYNVLFGILYIGLGILYAGASFPGFRAKEKCITYLMIPASRLEKFLAEYLSRIVLYLLVFPVVFWLLFNAEGYILASLSARFSFTYQHLFFFPELKGPAGSGSLYLLIVSMLFFILNLFFAGAAIFEKYPLIKTLFSLALIFFFNLLLVYLAVEVFGLKEYKVSATDLHLIPGDRPQAIRFFTVTSFIANVLLIGVAWFKMKEKEV